MMSGVLGVVSLGVPPFPASDRVTFFGRKRVRVACAFDTGWNRSRGKGQRKKKEDVLKLDRGKLWHSRASQILAVQKPESSTSSETEVSSEVADIVLQDIEILTESQAELQQRLFSNVNQATLQHEPGNLLSAVLLVAGTTIGAGILAIPAVTQDAGFLASSATVVTCWLYMVGTGLLVAEVNVNTMCELGAGGVSIVSMADRTLGRPGVRVACGTYIFIHYALLVAYIARSSEIISNSIGSPLWLSGLIFTGAIGGLCYFASPRTVGAVNGVLVAGIVTSFAALVVVAGGDLHLESLARVNLGAVLHSVPVIALSFVYQNVVPVICTDLEGDLPKIRSAVVYGTSIPLVMFLVWDALILGSFPAVSDSINIAPTMVDPLAILRSTNGVVGPIIETFSLLAVATSYIGFVLGLADFLADLLKLPSGGLKQPLPYLLTLIPPLALALTSPGIFFKALDFAGTYGVLVLFGIIPAAMAWSERYSDTSLPTLKARLVPGGRITLSIIIGFAGVIITSEIARQLSP
ncbi:tyrosine-specific transport protein [Marchantia polymorpha subsp. ruderalis]|uniref:Tyrosine-specific transport protein n=2 Tax=Marchantia polymorpha TaxID=3197 RepID=A0AAF6AW32_MARPO|nr:hypothetical protein MARPO_0007s0093 [Marchantia polymorpha]BBN03966.1 hypothetical protein Mp_3g00970 [Marchantia polymorpha subsp. ruderalis]|eukprot:PTQ47655.1 hypothetical protein MARPO_0007s0093 [Marchantia polymorpha]